MSPYRSWISLVLCVLGVASTPARTLAQPATGDQPAADPAAPASEPADPAGPPSQPPPVEGDTAETTATPTADPNRRPDGSVDTADVTQSGIISDEQVLTEQHLGVETVRRGTDPYEDPNKRYFFLGGFYHHHFIPSGMIELFVQEAPAVANPQAGIELTIRRDSFEVIASAWYADFTTVGPFLANGDPPVDVEIIDSNLRAVMAGATMPPELLNPDIAIARSKTKNENGFTGWLGRLTRRWL